MRGCFKRAATLLSKWHFFALAQGDLNLLFNYDEKSATPGTSQLRHTEGRARRREATLTDDCGRSSMKYPSMKRLVTGYVVLLHIFVVGVVWKTGFIERVSSRLRTPKAVTKPEITEYYHRIVRYHGRSVDAVPDDCVIFIGDSITQGLAVSAVCPIAVNYGIGSDTTRGVLKRIPIYMPALKRAKCIVIAIGVNDTPYRTASEAIQNYVRILDTLPQNRPVVVSGILPVDKSSNANLARRIAWVTDFNHELRELCDQRDNVTFVDSSADLDTDSDGQLDTTLHDGDGLHLNSAGNLAWAANLRSAIESSVTPHTQAAFRTEG